MPSVSIIMGVYNFNNPVEIRRSIKSIINQTYCDWEFIICDDGSTDGTWELLQEIAGEDKRIITFRNKHNSGLAASLNNCIKFAKGKYVVRQDADDYSTQDRLIK